MGHGVPTAEGGPYSTENYVVVEAGLFGPPDAKIQLSYKDFSLRINVEKDLAEPQPALRDSLRQLERSEWEPASFGVGRGSNQHRRRGEAASPGRQKVVPKMPIELRHVMEQRVLKGVDIGRRTRGFRRLGCCSSNIVRGDQGQIRSMELLYNGPTGKATLALHQP